MKNWKGILIGSSVLLLVIIVLVVVIVVIVRKRKQQAAALPENTDWGKGLSASESETIQRIAKGLYDEMKGIQFWSRNIEIYREYAATSDRIFVGVANHFADKYGNGENLAQWMDSEAYGWTSIETRGIVTGIMQRLEKFGITA